MLGVGNSVARAVCLSADCVRATSKSAVVSAPKGLPLSLSHASIARRCFSVAVCFCRVLHVCGYWCYVSMTNPNDRNFVDDVIEMLNRSVSEGDFMDSENGDTALCTDGECDEPDNQSVRSGNVSAMDFEEELSGFDILHSERDIDENSETFSMIIDDDEKIENKFSDDEQSIIPNMGINECEQTGPVVVDENCRSESVRINFDNEEDMSGIEITGTERSTGRGIEAGSSRGSASVRGRARGTVRVRGRGVGRGSSRGRGTGNSERTGAVQKLTKKQKERIEWNRQWLNVTNEDPGPVSNVPIVNDNFGTNLPMSFDINTKPLEYFLLFFNDDLLDLICTESNLYGSTKKNVEGLSPKSRFNKWEPISVVELKAVIGVLLNMGLHPLPDIKDYFSSRWVNKIPFFGDVFSRDRFLILFWTLHFSHEEGPDRDLKIRPIVNHMKEVCKIFYTPSSTVAVDESTVSFKGKIVFRVYNPMKPTKFGLKIFVLSDSINGYIYDFDPYYGKNEDDVDDDLLKTTKIVTQLCKTLVKNASNPPSGTHVYIDRYYNSPQLATELSKLNMYVTGTVLGVRTQMPILSKKLEVGEIEGRRNGDNAVVFWKDKRLVTVLSTKHKVDKNHIVDLPTKIPGIETVKKPEAIADYTKHMGGVDRSDHFISNYQFLRRSKKWYRKMFFWLLDVSVMNSYILYKMNQEGHNKRPMSHKQFRLSLIEDLVRGHMEGRLRLDRRRPGRPKENACQRLDGKLHLMGKFEKGSRKCHVCLKKKLRKETVYFCKTCSEQPFLHPDRCFEMYHTELDY